MSTATSTKHDTESPVARVQEAHLWHSLTAAEVLKRLDVTSAGLSAGEAGKRLARAGPNEITRRKPVSPGRLLVRQFANFFILVLLAAAVLAFCVSFLPGESNRRLTAFFILGIVVLSVALSFFQEFRAQRSLEALDKLLVFEAVVVREGVRRKLRAAEIVPGDLIALAQGQKVPADARLLETYSLRADESALTGESVGVDKSPESVPKDAPLAERACMVYAGTYITHGTGVAAVVQTGMGTEVGRIAVALQQMEERATPFQVEVRKMARQMTQLVAVLGVFIALFMYYVLHEHWIDVALNTLSLAVATIPESLPIVLTFALALGARQMARRHALVRRLSVVESLGSVDTICTDKTGTLTQNLMAVQKLLINGEVFTAAESRSQNGSLTALYHTAILCNGAAFEDGATPKFLGDPVDTAFLRAAHEAGVDIDGTRSAFPKVNELPFSPERKMMTTVHEHNGQWMAFAKGSPAAIMARCTSCLFQGKPLSFGDTHCEIVRTTTAQLESEGLYVLALAQKALASPKDDGALEQGMTFLGLVAMLDPPRPEVAEAIASAQAAGIRVVMITGDNPLTARAIARRLGLGDRVAEASELDALSSETLRQRMREIDIVARATPQTKQEVLQALQADAHFVAMTGDGVNDATALKQADVGVAMGLRGTDIAKESATMVLLDDNFSTITAAVEEGRRIFDNIRKFTNYLLSTSLGEVFAVLALSLVGYFPLSAKMLLWINVVTDLVPASALANDPAVPRVMQRRPRRQHEPILNKAIYATIAGSVFRTLAAYGIIFWAGLRFGDVTYARTMLFTSIVLHAAARMLVVRQMDELSLWSNRALLWSYLLAVLLQLCALYTPLRHVFGVVPLDWRAWAVMIPVLSVSSLTGIYMTRWILRLVPLWEK